MEMHNPPHPGEVLREYMGDVDVTTLAVRVGVNRVSMSRLLNGQNGVSARMAIALARVLGTSAEMWMNLQVQYDLWQERAELKSGRIVEVVRLGGPSPGTGTKEIDRQHKEAPLEVFKTAGS